MNEHHETNRRHWDRTAARWKQVRDQDGLWARCPREPKVAFEGRALEFIREHLGNMRGRQVWILGT